MNDDKLDWGNLLATVDDERFVIKEGCKNCGKITIRIPHQLLADMLKNCKQSDDRDMFIRQLRKIDKSQNLSACLEREGIWDLVEVYW